MATRYILAALSVIFLAAALARRFRGSADGGGQARTWLVIAVVFAAVSIWLFVVA